VQDGHNTVVSTVSIGVGHSTQGYYQCKVSQMEPCKKMLITPKMTFLQMALSTATAKGWPELELELQLHLQIKKLLPGGWFYGLSSIFYCTVTQNRNVQCCMAMAYLYQA